MTYSDDTLMAYADGELEAAERAAIEQAMRTDPAIAAVVERHRALRADVAAAFAGILRVPRGCRRRHPSYPWLWSATSGGAGRGRNGARWRPRSSSVSWPAG